MKLAGACAIAVMLAAGGAAHAAVQLPQEFVDLCLKTSTLSEAEAAARAAGYARATPEFARSVQSLAEGEVYSREVEGQTFVFISTSAERESANSGKKLDADGCVVGSRPVQPGLAEALKPLIGVGDLQRMGNERAFVYEQQASKRLRVDTSNPRRAQLISRRGALRMVMVTEKAGFSAAALVKPVLSGR